MKNSFTQDIFCLQFLQAVETVRFQKTGLVLKVNIQWIPLYGQSSIGRLMQYYTWTFQQNSCSCVAQVKKENHTNWW